MPRRDTWKRVSKFSALQKSSDKRTDKDKEFKRRKVALLTRNARIKCLPSFLYRTLHDYIGGANDLSRYQLTLVDSWERAGLDRGNARRTLERLYAIGQELFDHLDESYYAASPEKIDSQLFKDLSGVDWDDFFNASHMVSPRRLSRALTTASDAGLTSKEKRVTKTIFKTHNKQKWSTFAKSKEGRAYMERLLHRPPRFVVQDRTKRKAVRLAERDLSIDDAGTPHHGKAPTAQSLLAAIDYKVPEPPPACFDWFLNRLGHRIHSYGEYSGDDPVFVYSAWVLADGTAPQRLTNPQVYWPEDDEKHDHFRPSFRKIFPPARDEWSSGRGNLFFSNEVLLLRVDAFENDDYFGEDTEGALRFGFDVASKIAAVDPTGISGIMVGLGQLALQIAFFIDWLDDDDSMGFYNSYLRPEWLPKDEENYPWKTTPYIRFGYGEDSDWEFRVESEVRTAVFI